MLNLQHVSSLAAALKTDVRRLREVADTATDFCRELTLLDPAKPDKPRDVLDVRGDLRAFQVRLLRRVILPKLAPSTFSHGGVRGRDIKTNAAEHRASRFAFTADVANFYPSIGHIRVYRLFMRLGCSPDVARICTQLCTYRYHLALGLITSPALADQVMLGPDRQIAAACEACGVTYTRYVDDLTISGHFDLEFSGIPNVVTRILEYNGLKLNPTKTLFGRLADGFTITKLRVRNGRLDVRREYVEELERQLDDAAALAADGEFVGPYYTPNQITGRVHFVCWINRGRTRQLKAKFNAIPWGRVEKLAKQRGYVALKKELVAKVQ